MKKLFIKILILAFVIIPKCVFAEANVIDARGARVNANQITESLDVSQMTEEEIRQQQLLYEQALAEYNLLLQQQQQLLEQQNNESQVVVNPNVSFTPSIFDVYSNMNNGDFNNEISVRSNKNTPTGIINKDVKSIDYKMSDDTHKYNGKAEMPEELRIAHNNTFNGTRAKIVYDNEINR